MLSDAEDAIELFSFTLFGGSPEDAAMRDFRPPGCRRSSKQVKAGPSNGLPDNDLHHWPPSADSSMYSIEVEMEVPFANVTGPLFH
jgi:hypothetical protein